MSVQPLAYTLQVYGGPAYPMPAGGEAYVGQPILGQGMPPIPMAQAIQYTPGMGQPVMGQPVYGYTLPLEAAQAAPAVAMRGIAVYNPEEYQPVKL